MHSIFIQYVKAAGKSLIQVLNRSSKAGAALVKTIASLLVRDKAPAKRSQHANATYTNIVGRNVLCAFGHCVAMCCDMLDIVSSLKMVKFEPTIHNTSQHVATGWPNAHNMLRPTMLRYRLARA